MLYAALALVIVAVLSTFAVLLGGLGIPLDIGRNASVTALVLAAVALLLFVVGSRRPSARKSRR